MDEKELKEAIAGLMKDKSKRDALAEMIVEFVQPGHITVDYVSMLLNTRNLNPGDLLVKKVRKGIEVRTLVPGAMHLKSEITVQDRINYVLDGADVGVTANYWELENGQIGTVESIRTEMMAKLRDYFQGKVFTALASVWNNQNTPSNYTSCAGTVSLAALENAINVINQTVPGGAKAIVGTRALLTPITKFAAFWSNTGNAVTVGSQTKIDEVLNTGWIGNYMGVPLLPLNQIYDNLADYKPLLPTDKILVIGENVGEFITYGNVQTKQWDDMRVTPPQWNLELYQQFGLIVTNAQGIYVIQIT